MALPRLKSGLRAEAAIVQGTEELYTETNSAVPGKVARRAFSRQFIRRASEGRKNYTRKLILLSLGQLPEGLLAGNSFAGRPRDERFIHGD